VSGWTDSEGDVFLYVDVPEDAILDSLFARMEDESFTLIDSWGTYSNWNTAIWPRFVVIHDEDQNGIRDEWELPLAQKFCPYLILHGADNGVRPVPVEIMDRNGDGILGWEDIIVDVLTVGADHVLACSPYYIWVPEIWWDEQYPFYKPIEGRAAWIYLDTNGDGNPDFAPDFYILISHFEWGHYKDTHPILWYEEWNARINDHSDDSRYMEGTTYAHLFRHGNEYVIQYWFFYPFNAAANRHEGDWEHINVVIDSQNPSLANITRVEYYFHWRVKPTYTAGVDYYLVDGTHPKVFVGGHTTFGGCSGEGSHGSYPKPGRWDDINELGTDEDVHGDGLHINFGNYQNIVIIPNISAIDGDSNLNWVIFGGHWGFPDSHPTAGDTEVNFLGENALDFAMIVNMFIGEPFVAAVAGMFAYFAATVGANKIEETNVAPPGPAYSSGWNAIYTNSGYELY